MDEIKKPIIMDQTLREGEQAPNVAFSIEEKKAILTKLDEAAVPLVEIGLVARNSPFLEEIEQLLTIPLKNAELVVCCLAKEEDFATAVELGCEHILMICPTSSVLLEKKLATTKEELIQRVKKIIAGYEENKTFGLIFEDTARTKNADIGNWIDLAVELGASEVYLADSLGILSPERVSETCALAEKKAAGRLQIGCHFHNDLGLALANTLSAFQHGASILTSSINGLGERAGTVCIIQLLTALNIHHHVKLAKFVESVTGLIIGPNTPLIGYNAFRHSAGVHADALLKDVDTYQGIAPSLLGTNHSFIPGKLSGSALLRYFAKQAKFDDKLWLKDTLRIREQLANIGNSNLRSALTGYYQCLEEQSLEAESCLRQYLCKKKDHEE
jgi:isopropylmalate/homocitrate/citramalate synthase